MYTEYLPRTPPKPTPVTDFLTSARSLPNCLVVCGGSGESSAMPSEVTKLLHSGDDFVPRFLCFYSFHILHRTGTHAVEPFSFRSVNNARFLPVAPAYYKTALGKESADDASSYIEATTLPSQSSSAKTSSPK